MAAAERAALLACLCRSYEQELVNHADKVKALNEAEAAQDTLKAKLETVEKVRPTGSPETCRCGVMHCQAATVAPGTI